MNKSYTNKPRIWQLTHSSRIKRRLLDKSNHISDIYALPKDFVRESINQLFIDVDNHFLQLRKFLQSASQVSNKSNVLFQRVKKTDNQWRSLQLERARQIFPDIDTTECTEENLLKKILCSHCRNINTNTRHSKYKLHCTTS